MTAGDSKNFPHSNEVIAHDSFRGYSVVFEDNGRVAYGYLVQDQEFVSDVWLYNHGNPPLEPEWHSPHKLPFANPVNFVCEHKFQPIRNANEVSFVWVHKEEIILFVEIHLRGLIYGILKPGFKPGWARLSIRDSPIAKVMSFKKNGS